MDKGHVPLFQNIILYHCFALVLGKLSIKQCLKRNINRQDFFPILIHFSLPHYRCSPPPAYMLPAWLEFVTHPPPSIIYCFSTLVEDED